MATQTSKAVPGISLTALDAITDPNTREVVRALVDGYHVRNGQTGSGDNRFITASELGLAKGQTLAGLISAQQGAAVETPQLRSTDVARIVNDLQALVTEGPLFKELGTRVGLLDAPLGKVAKAKQELDKIKQDLTLAKQDLNKTKQDLLDAANTALAEFDAENSQTGNGVTNLIQLFDGAIKQTQAIKTTVYAPGGALPLASAAILAINDVSATSTSANARALYGVNAVVTDPVTGLAASRADYISKINVEADARRAVAEKTELLTAKVNDLTTGLEASTADYISRITTEADARKAVATKTDLLTAKVNDLTTGLEASTADYISRITTEADERKAVAAKTDLLTTKVNDLTTGLEASTADYISRITTEADERKAVAAKTDGLTTKVNDLTTGLEASTADYISRIKTEADARKAVAQDVSGLQASLTSTNSKISDVEGLIVSDRQIDLDNAQALASATNMVYAALGTKTRMFWQSTQPPTVEAVEGQPYKPKTATSEAVPAVLPVEASPKKGDVWYNTSDGNRPRYWTGSAWADGTDNRAAAVAAGLVSTEATTRLSQANALVDAVKTVWGALGGSSGLIQGGENVTVNTAGAQATAFTQVQSALKDSNGNLIASAAIKQTTDTLVTKSGEIEARWVVNMDAGVAKGFRQAGFGMAGSLNQNGIEYAFGVRADQFWIAAPGDNSTTPITAKIPFMVKTGTWTDNQGVTQQPGVYLNELFATSAKIGVAQIQAAHIGTAQIDRAHIKSASVDTLRIGANAVTVPGSVTGAGPYNVRAGYPRQAAGQVWITFPDTVKIMAMVNWTAGAAGTGGNTRVEIEANGWQFHAASDSNINGYSLSHNTNGFATLAAGTYKFEIFFSNDWHEGSYDVGSWTLFVMGVMR